MTPSLNSSLNSESPRFSVIICTLNRPDAFSATILQIVALPNAGLEIIVIDQSEPELADVNRACCAKIRSVSVRYVHVEKRGLPNARNVGLRLNSAPIVIFVDDDVVILSQQFLRAHLAAFEDPNVGGATGRSVERRLQVNSRTTACHVSLGGRTIFNLMGTRKQQIQGCKGSNMSFRTSIFPVVGGFDRQTELLEDADFSLRVIKAGWKILYVPDAEIVHLSIPNGGVRTGTWINAEKRRFRSTAYFVLKHRGLLGAVPFLLTFFLIAINRAWRYGSPSIFKSLMAELLVGYRRWLEGPRQRIEMER